MTPSQPSSHNDSAVGSFLTGAIVGALTALTFGTQEGRRTARSLASALKSLTEEFAAKQGITPQKITSYQQEFKQSVQELNTTLQNTGQQIIDRLHRPSTPPQYFHKDNTDLS